MSLKNCSSCKVDYMWSTSTCHCECNKAGKIDEFLDIKNCSREKRLIVRFVLACVDEILNKPGTSLNDEKVICEKYNFLFNTISLVIICLLLLVVICVSCYFCSRKH